MKICAIICELNPLHNGHKYLFDRARAISGCDKLLLIMSGSFSQRGEMCILDKYTRAEHAILSGADAVIELPSPFAVSPAEIFSKGAVKILSSIPEIYTLAFGCENNDKDKLLKYSKILINESDKFKNHLRSALDSGKSYISALNSAFTKACGDSEFLTKPNNILALEYTKSIFVSESKIDILPIKRIGSGYNQVEISESYSSASGIRNNLNSPLIKKNVPSYVFEDLKKVNYDPIRIDLLTRYALLNASKETLADQFGCSEGLENKLKSSIYYNLDGIIESCTSKRYSASRIARILTANVLNLSKASTERYLNSELYIHPLAIKKESKTEILTALSKSNYPLVLRQRDLSSLCITALECFNKTRESFKIWNILNSGCCRDFDYMSVV